MGERVNVPASAFTDQARRRVLWSYWVGAIVASLSNGLSRAVPATETGPLLVLAAITMAMVGWMMWSTWGLAAALNTSRWLAAPLVIAFALPVVALPILWSLGKESAKAWGPIGERRGRTADV